MFSYNTWIAFRFMLSWSRICSTTQQSDFFAAERRRAITTIYQLEAIFRWSIEVSAFLTSNIYIILALCQCAEYPLHDHLLHSLCSYLPIEDHLTCYIINVRERLTLKKKKKHPTIIYTYVANTHDLKLLSLNTHSLSLVLYSLFFPIFQISFVFCADFPGQKLESYASGSIAWSANSSQSSSFPSYRSWGVPLTSLGGGHRQQTGCVRSLAIWRT